MTRETNGQFSRYYMKCRTYKKPSLVHDVEIFYICHLCRIGQDVFLNIRHQKFEYAKSLEVQENTEINRALLEPLFRAVFKKSGLYLAIPLIAVQKYRSKYRSKIHKK